MSKFGYKMFKLLYPEFVKEFNELTIQFSQKLARYNQLEIVEKKYEVLKKAHDRLQARLAVYSILILLTELVIHFLNTHP